MDGDCVGIILPRGLWDARRWCVRIGEWFLPRLEQVISVTLESLAVLPLSSHSELNST